MSSGPSCRWSSAGPRSCWPPGRRSWRTRQAELEAKSKVSESEILSAAREKSRGMIAHAEERCRRMYQVTNEYTEDALARAEEAMQMALDEVKQSRVNFRSASAAKMQEQRAKMNGTDEPESTDE